MRNWWRATNSPIVAIMGQKGALVGILKAYFGHTYGVPNLDDILQISSAMSALRTDATWPARGKEL